MTLDWQPSCSCAVCQGEREVEIANVACQQYDKDFTCTF